MLFRRAIAPSALFLLFLAPLHAQNVLVAEYDHKPVVVRAARRTRPYFEENGKLVAADDFKFTLHKVDEYLPVFIAVRNLKVGTRSLNLINQGGAKINNEFRFRANFESAYPLDEVFVVLVLTFEDKSKSLFLQEVGRLTPHEPRTLDLVFPTSYALGPGHFELHVFVNGMEALHSNQPFEYREAVLDRMVAKHIKGRPDGNPEPFIGPPPEYPSKLFKKKIKGRATVRLRIRPTGAVIDPEIVEASDPAFGEAAVEAMRQWRFYPRIKAGRPVETTAEMPMDFEPPPDS